MAGEYVVTLSLPPAREGIMLDTRLGPHRLERDPKRAQSLSITSTSSARMVLIKDLSVNRPGCLG